MGATLILSICFVLFYVVRMFLRYKKQLASKEDVVFWLAILISILMIGFFPSRLSVGVAKFLGFTDSISPGYFLIIIYLFVFTHYLIRKIERTGN